MRAGKKFLPILRSGPQNVQSVPDPLVSWAKESEESPLDVGYPVMAIIGYELRRMSWASYC